MSIYIELMKEEYARKILNWTYDKPYEIYNMDNDEENMEELLDGSYYAVVDKKENLIGYFCFGVSAQVPAGNEYGAYNNEEFIDIGLGMRPDLCSKGNGYEFIKSGLEYANKELLKDKIRLTVAEFNTRAISLYEKAGFKRVMEFWRKNKEGDFKFIIMELYLR
jgi:RimJ/RimL family protein N-acetyltransferase